MKHVLKITVALTVVVFLAALSLAFLRPVLEAEGRYCFYCGHESTTVSVFGLSVWHSNGDKSVYQDNLPTPQHAHRMLEDAGFRLWLFRGEENWDNFGWGSFPVRKALVNGLAKHPELQAEIFEEFLALDPRDQQAKLKFVLKYTTQTPLPPNLQ